MPETFSKPPITEALIDIRVQMPAALGLADLDPFLERLKPEFPGKSEPLSPAARSNRGPQPPEQLLDAIQDPIHADPGRSRAVKRRRGRRRGRG